MMPVRLEPKALRSRVKHSTTEPLCYLIRGRVLISVTVSVLSFVVLFAWVKALGLRKQLFSHHLDLIYMPAKYNLNISNGIKVMERTSCHLQTDRQMDARLVAISSD